MESFPDDIKPYEDEFFEFARIIGQYWPEWAYHNFTGHGYETVYEFFKLVRYARQNGIDISQDEVVAGGLSALEHDAGNHWGEPFFYDYPEERAAVVGDGLARKFGFSTNIIEQKHAATLATRPGSKCTSLLDRMVRRADIANLAWEYDRFKAKTVDYWRELQAQNKEPKSFKVWVCSDIVREKLLQLLDEDLSLGGFDKGVLSPSQFQDTVLNNFTALHNELNSPDFVEPELDLAA